ncbi:signal peptide peptidase SppA [Croceivirga thetidis]|uniref:Signal peptide peptidase SppA n=1 Tax=Croceivirga thetidis TaxID=2721623 RepID=A0ABX1GP92_9FLAO|nr:signal peptide peptidase SppA [Croceivirga thetidis]NKI30582.1 signal peptide peptidase SppA [Croceivirga thetidis]
MKFLRNLLAAILGCLIAFGILVVMFFIFAALVGSAGDGITVKENSVLDISLSEPIYDYLGNNPEDPFGSLFSEGQGLDEILHAITVAKTDPNIKGIRLGTSFSLAGMAQTQEIRRAMADFKSEGKFILAHADFYSQKDYWLASIADKVYLNPQGGMDFKGLASEVLFYKDLQEKTGIKMEVIRHGKYKSAVEPFLSNTMSDENRQQIKELITSIWDSMLEDISTSRNISTENLNSIADTLGARLPAFAVESGLIDGTLFHDEFDAQLREKLGLGEDDKINSISLEDYGVVAQTKGKPSGTDKIAVVYAQGEILYGEGTKDVIGQGIINRALKKARENEKVKAVVLRVDSPGGSSLVSDIIWREVELTRQTKPVVVSFGNIAASGGYYIAAAADRIIAEPTTITGSIGVFGTIPNISELSEDIGVNAEQVGTNANSVDYSLFEPMTESFRSQVEESIEETYDTFVSLVAQGRQKTFEEIDAIAQGRVWSGVEAQKIGLVDELGGLDKAIEVAAELAEIESFGIRKYPRYKSDFELLMEDLSSAKLKLGNSLLKEEIGDEAYEVLTSLKKMTENQGVQARMPYELNIK